MNIEQISPYVRFAAKQTFTHGQQNMVGYDHRIYFGLKNTGSVTINGVRYEIYPNTFILWQAGTVYSYSANDVNLPFEAATCNFDFTKCAEKYSLPIPPVPERFFEKNKIVSEKAVFDNTPDMNGVIYIPEALALKASMLSLVEEYSRKLKFYTLKLNTILQDILFNVARLTDDTRFPQNEDLVSRVLNYIQTEFTNNPTNKTIGKHFGYHPNYINSLIVKYTGTPLHRYIINLKLSEAVKLLMGTDLSVIEIAQSVNIPDPQYFSRLFKLRFKKSPTQFRQSH